MTSIKRDNSDLINRIIGNEHLASSIRRSIALAIKRHCIGLAGKNPQEILEQSLKASIYDIENDPKGRGLLFRRLIEYGPYNPDEPEMRASDGKTLLSDPELGECVEFIFSHMVNRFKGELAELLALEPCSSLVMKLCRVNKLTSKSRLYYGQTIQERQHFRARNSYTGIEGRFAKGADGLVIEKLASSRKSRQELKVHGVIEVKSMMLSRKMILEQIDHHIDRLRDDVRLAGDIWQVDSNQANHNFIRIMVMPSKWELSRKFYFKTTKNVRKMVFPKSEEPPNKTQTIELSKNLWKITLDWSEEALEEAGFEMTYWYMSKVGEFVYADKSVPKNWKGMTPAMAGYNAIKMMLYYTLLRPITDRQKRLATRLYNVYCFGYPIGSSYQEMLWPEMLK